MAKGHCLFSISGCPNTVKIAPMTAAKAIFMFSTPTAAIKISSTHILLRGMFDLIIKLINHTWVERTYFCFDWYFKLC